jgi:flavin reductase (DIM6/NTAB) family NADH-FMN oxidoreductase RutF
VNTAFQITSEPVTIAISINKKNLTHEYIESSGIFSVSILSEEAPLNFIGKFGFKSGRKEEKFKDTGFRMLASGCPIVTDHVIGYLEAGVKCKFDCQTHTLFLGCLTDSALIAQGIPMTYNYYHHVKMGFTPPSAPTFIRGEKKGNQT